MVAVSREFVFGRREWLSEARAAADASDDPETLEYIREVRAQIEN